MSLSPANILQRLQELKMWQESHEELLKKTKNLMNSSGNVSAASDYQTIEGLSAFDSTAAEENAPPNWESQAISPTKTFNELLEEKLAEDPGPKNVTEKPKRPFLKKGSGLQRFRMNPGRKAQPNKAGKRADERNVSKATPLKAPDLSIKPKATWHKVENEPKNHNEMTQVNTQTLEPSEQTLYEKALEKELLIFEALEQKAENSSFCSTNSSVVRILSSTPTKIRKEIQSPIMEEKRVHWESQSDDDEVIESNLERKDIADILLRLKSLAENNIPTRKAPPIIETSEDEKWSTTESSSVDTSISSGDLELTLKTEKRDVAVGTNEESPNSYTFCSDKIDTIIKEYEKKIEDVVQDKNRINQIRKDLEQKKETLERDFMKKKRELEDERTNLIFELDSERKKLIREKQVFQTYMKDSQNRPNKKEREEISNLKQEVADLRETLKLKESKNGMTQARLRNQVKQLEKENSNLKDEIEKLTKENARLSASQKLNRRPSDTKILHEINKNISKLTQKATNRKSEDSYEDESDRIVRQKRTKQLQVEHRAESEEDSFLEMANTRSGDYLDVEKQYENTFRNKVEHLLEDGTKQTKYANGNVKTVSSDGNFITMKYFNGDIQETNLLDGTVKYFFFSKNIWQTTYADGLEVLEFSDGIKEKRYVDGKCEVILPDNVVQITSPDGSQETKYPDGSVVKVKSNGDKILLLPNGQKEIETKEYKRREYPDGTVKILYPDGTQETRYSNGRVRIKDGDGNLLVDTQS
ncbi:centromere protein J [Asbolus verrucosus]|uniref:Centromere protein J n=1 Tax=Asbolus verrucosus TaxID=1661398 RepID=A0A482W5T6_ASBVE|nr:centromere protein J [Asbolus verrucosus]